MAEQERVGLRWLHLSREVRSCLPRPLALALLRSYKPFALRDMAEVERVWRTRDRARYSTMCAQGEPPEAIPASVRRRVLIQFIGWLHDEDFALCRQGPDGVWRPLASSAEQVLDEFETEGAYARGEEQHPDASP